MATYKMVDSTDPDRPPRLVPDRVAVRGDLVYFRNCDSFEEAMRRQRAWHLLHQRLWYLTVRRGHMACHDACDCGLRDEWLKVERLIGGLERGLFFSLQ